MSNNHLIFKNTIYLYLRQISVLVVALFTTRIILNVLGVEDFGLYNLIAGVVSLLTIVTSSLTSSTQRFLAISLGKENDEEFKTIFDVCFTLFVVISLVVIILGETIGLWFLNTELIIPHGREFAANCTYQLAVMAFVFNLIRVPYNAAIISHEKMDFYAWISIFQVSGQLLIAYCVYFIKYDHLITYSLLHVGVTLLINFVYIIYCRKRLDVKLHRLSFNRQYFDQIFSFSFWTFFGALSSIGTRQGINILINRFFGVRLNAASSVSTKVSGAAYDFVANFTTAYRPQILKLYAKGENEELYTLISLTTRLSCFLFAAIMLPLLINVDSLLSLWLGDVPEYANSFCILLMIYLFIDALQSPLIVLVHAIGDIKRFQLTFSTINTLNLPVMWYFLHIGCNPNSIYICFIVFNIFTSLYRIIYVKKRSNLSIRHYLMVIFRIITTLSFCYFIAYSFDSFVVEVDNWLTLLWQSAVIFVLTLLTILIVGVDKNERLKLKKILIQKKHK